MAKPMRPRATHIKVSADTPSRSLFVVRGWLAGADTYLWFGERDHVDASGAVVYARFFGALGGYRLYRLAKAIVRHYESQR